MISANATYGGVASGRRRLTASHQIAGTSSIIAGYAASRAPNALSSNRSMPGTNVATASCATVAPRTSAGSQISACRERCTRRSCRLAGPLLGQPRVDAPLCLLGADVLHPGEDRPAVAPRVQQGAEPVAGDEGGRLLVALRARGDGTGVHGIHVGDVDDRGVADVVRARRRHEVVVRVGVARAGAGPISSCSSAWATLPPGRSLRETTEAPKTEV